MMEPSSSKDKAEPSSTSLQGSCLCGQVCYAISGGLEQKMAHCHCVDCRKFHGAAFSSFGSVLAKNLKWTLGQELLTAFATPNGVVRQFCKVCGSSMTFQSKHHNGRIEFSLATLDDNDDDAVATPSAAALEGTPDAHIYYARKVSWFSPQDGLPKWPKNRGEGEPE